MNYILNTILKEKKRNEKFSKCRRNIIGKRVHFTYTNLYATTNAVNKDLKHKVIYFQTVKENE